MTARASSREHPEASAEAQRRMAEIFAAMGDPSRLRILLQLQRGERCVSELAAKIGVSDSAVSQHLRLLRALRLVRSRKQGRRVFYALDDHHVESLLRVSLEHAEGG